MNLREILVLLISFFLAVTIILTFRKIINYRKNSIRKSKQSSISNDEEVKVELENFSEEDYIDDDIPPEPELSSDDLIYLHIESDQSNSIQYKDLLNYFDSNDINLADEGGWLKIYLDNSNNFSLVNGLKPGKFLPEEGIDSTSIITMILIANEQNNCVEAFQNMAEMSYKLAAYLSANVLDSDRNKLTKQMYDHYVQQAEETDLKKIKLS
ncbi:cell division protein ZipA C-terminal FtsZ-binding domain-containing protein [SAR86 cluster bacterium]|nr:cell division protein ZipA C-terminal FtsZ-binding domain-containing protein [SAR86 cluster bacterium]